MMLSRAIGVPYEEVSYWCAGINHLAWFLEFRRGNDDLYPLIWKAMEQPELLAKEKVRFEIMKHFGYFPTESSPHDSEYMPYFRKTAEEMAEFGLTLREVPDGPPSVRAWMRDTGVTGDENRPWAS